MPTRRQALFQTASALAAGTLAAPALATALPSQVAPLARRNLSSFRQIRWEDHFDRLDRVTIVADTQSFALHHWDTEGNYRLYPTSVPMTEELTRRGYTEVVRKKVGPSWTPTANMRERDPSLPPFLPPGPDNPLGTHALYLDWPAYLIHGTHDTRKIGRASSSGCIGLYNHQIEELYGLVPVGTQVRLI